MTKLTLTVRFENEGCAASSSGAIYLPLHVPDYLLKSVADVVIEDSLNNGIQSLAQEATPEVVACLQRIFELAEAEELTRAGKVY